jgi:uncharacterized protein (DUF1499 family)
MIVRLRPSLVPLFSALLALAACHGTRPATLGVTQGVLRPCTRTTNCVASETGTPEGARVSSFPAPDGEASLARLRDLLASLPRTTLITSTPHYVHAECTSRVMRFIDDVELRYDSVARVIHVRSAARLGIDDLGVNRTRVETLRARYERR